MISTIDMVVMHSSLIDNRKEFRWAAYLGIWLYMSLYLHACLFFFLCVFCLCVLVFLFVCVHVSDIFSRNVYMHIAVIANIIIIMMLTKLDLLIAIMKPYRIRPGLLDVYTQGRGLGHFPRT